MNTGTWIENWLERRGQMEQVTLFETHETRWVAEIDRAAGDVRVHQEMRYSGEDVWHHSPPLLMTFETVLRLAKECDVLPKPDPFDPTSEEAVIHSKLTDSLPDGHPGSCDDWYCKACGCMVHAANNETMTDWVEWNNEALCWECFAKTPGAPDARLFKRV